MMGKGEKIVVDTNVLVSGFISHGTPALLLDVIEEGRVDLFLSEDILHEFRRVISYPRISKYLRRDRIENSELVAWLFEHGHIVSPAKLSDHPIPGDLDDEKFLACALAAQADIVVSGDLHLLALGAYRHIAIMGVRAYMERWS